MPWLIAREEPRLRTRKKHTLRLHVRIFQHIICIIWKRVFQKSGNTWRMTLTTLQSKFLLLVFRDNLHEIINRTDDHQLAEYICGRKRNEAVKTIVIRVLYHWESIPWVCNLSRPHFHRPFSWLTRGSQGAIRAESGRNPWKTCLEKNRTIEKFLTLQNWASASGWFSIT